MRQMTMITFLHEKSFRKFKMVISLLICARYKEQNLFIVSLLLRLAFVFFVKLLEFAKIH